MSGEGPDPIDRLVHQLSRLPGIGTKSATRLAYHILRTDQLGPELAEALVAAHGKVGRCALCGNISASDPCSVCSNPRRDKQCICVVERSQDLQAIERASTFRGVFHVLGGTLSPLAGVGPEDLRIKELLARVADGTTEVIVATNPTVEGDATALYLAKLLKPLGLRVSRIARGLSVGAELEYTDAPTLSRAIEERRDI
ncbi:MAG: recombination mediator RecR [Myxococcota bacterium]|nr:recombination mediator RecR [Myxococcota bacterium]